MGQVWLIGGTQDSREIAQAMMGLNLPCLVTVTTPEGSFLYPRHPLLKIVVGALQASHIHDFIQVQHIQGIIDASHPYAVEISRLAMQISQEFSLPYIRYERPPIYGDNALFVEDFSALFTRDDLWGKRVFLTVGYKSLPLFKDYQDRAYFYARILPKMDSLKVALEAGFSPDRLIAFRPPLTLELEQALWQHWKIEIGVSKASGKAGGEDIKCQIAQKLNIPLIIIKRPSVIYPHQTQNMEEIKQFCCQWL